MDEQAICVNVLLVASEKARKIHGGCEQNNCCLGFVGCCDKIQSTTSRGIPKHGEAPDLDECEAYESTGWESSGRAECVGCHHPRGLQLPRRIDGT